MESRTSEIANMITVATQGAWVDSVTSAICLGTIRSNDHANIFRVQIIAITNKSTVFHRMKLTPMSTFRIELLVIRPVKKLSTGETGIPEPAEVLPLR